MLKERNKIRVIRFEPVRSPHTLGVMVTLQVKVLVGCRGQRLRFKFPKVKVLVRCRGQGLRFKFPKGSFTHIYT